MITTKLRFVEADEAPKTQREKKATLRALMKKKRAENANRDVKENLLIEHFYEAVFGEREGAGTRLTFFIYLSYSREAPTDRLIERLLEDGHYVCCPRIENGELVAVEYGEDFTLSDYGMREPIGEPFEGKIDVAVIPFLAVDKHGNRVGYGGGYYDRYLKQSQALRIAYGYGFQIVGEVPTETWDEKMDVIVTDEQVVFVATK